MKAQQHTAAGDAVTELILEIFRLNGRLLLAGDGLVSHFGLTSARWQVLGAIALAEQPQPVAWLARNMGLTRQAVQRLVNEMRGQGFVEFLANPHHKRAQLVKLTRRGEQIYRQAEAQQIPWANALAADMALEELHMAKQILRRLRERLEGPEPI